MQVLLAKTQIYPIWDGHPVVLVDNTIIQEQDRTFRKEAISFFLTVAILWVLCLCVYSVGHYAPNYAQVAAHHAVIQLRVNTIILATTISSTIMWVLWCHTNGLYLWFLSVQRNSRMQSIDRLRTSHNTSSVETNKQVLLLFSMVSQASASLYK